MAKAVENQPQPPQEGAHVDPANLRGAALAAYRRKRNASKQQHAPPESAVAQRGQKTPAQVKVEVENAYLREELDRMREPGISEIADRTAAKVVEGIKSFFGFGQSQKPAAPGTPGTAPEGSKCDEWMRGNTHA